MFERLAAEIKHALQIGDTPRALKQLEQMRRAAQETKSEPDLLAVIAAARELADALEGHERARALIVAFQARQVVAQLRRGQSLPKHAATVNPTAADLPAQLRELAALHNAGFLTDEEFQQAKKKLLA